MYEGIIETLIKLFAIITDFRDKLSDESTELVESYLKENFSKELEEKYLNLYKELINYYHIEHREILYENSGEGKRRINKKYLEKICVGIVDNFDLNTRFMIVSQLLNFIKKPKLNSDDLKMVHIVGSGLKIDPKEFSNLYRFFLFSIDKVKDKSNLFVVNGNSEYHDKQINHLEREGQQVELELIRIRSTNSVFLKYWGPRNMYLNGHRLKQNRLYIFPPGGILKTSRIVPIYYSSIMTRFIQKKGKARILFTAENISYKFNKKIYGLHPFSFLEKSGDLVGILGGSGVGKTTLLNVLNGKLKPSSGKISINGYDLHNPKNSDTIEGLIGYVPQDDLLLEELTVYENLKYNAKFCFGNMAEEQIDKIVQEALVDFDLVEAQDLVVGNPMKKILSGGQRKRLNIALELMREPSVLFVDEPTSGLSSADSEKVMYLLKRQCLKGKLVFANIHQPSSDIYKLFDRMIVMDKGGRVVFFGNPMDAITYFKHQADYINPDEGECMACGNVKAEQPLRIIEARMVDPFGKSIRKRKVSPEEWYEKYKENVEPQIVNFLNNNKAKKEEKVPDAFFKVPKWIQQFKLFLKRDFATKKSNRQYLSIALLEAPLLALILGFFSKFSDNGIYKFSENDNIPAFLFMSVVVSLFIGLTISAEEIFKDRKIRKREEFLNLSKGAYLSSKIILLFILSAVQMLSFVAIGHYILEIHDLGFSTWLILFTTACFANLLGLNLSAGLDSAVAIYVIIPLMLVPQILLSGVIIDFNKMHYSLSSYNRTPVIGDLMVSRWSYEALAVNQFKNNDYRKHIFTEEQEKNDLGFKTYYFLPELEDFLNTYNKYLSENKTDNALSYTSVLKNSFTDLLESVPKSSDSVLIAINSLGDSTPVNNQYSILSEYLDVSKSYYQDQYDKATNTLNEKYNSLLSLVDNDENALQELKEKHVNKQLESLVRDKYNTHKTYLSNNRIYQGDEPIFRHPVYDNGSAHFYASYKYIGKFRIETVWFNVIIIWLLTGFLMFALYLDLLRKLLDYILDWKLSRQAQMNERIFNNPMAFIKGKKRNDD